MNIQWFDQVRRHYHEEPSTIWKWVVGLTEEFCVDFPLACSSHVGFVPDETVHGFLLSVVAYPRPVGGEKFASVKENVVVHFNEKFDIRARACQPPETHDSLK